MGSELTGMPLTSLSCRTCWLSDSTWTRLPLRRIEFGTYEYMVYFRASWPLEIPSDAKGIRFLGLEFVVFAIVGLGVSDFVYRIFFHFV